MIENRTITFTTLVWQGIIIEVSYEANWLNMEGRYATAHLQLRSLSPENAPLPVTETGYRSLFLAPQQVAEHGGPLEFVRLWIAGAEKSVAWRAHLAEIRKRDEDGSQMSLF